jgi:hypothetical protein
VPIEEEEEELVRRSVKSEVLKTLNVKTTGYWYVKPCSFFDVYRVSRGACCPHYLGYMMDTEGYSEMSIQKAVVLRPFVFSLFGLNAP